MHDSSKHNARALEQALSPLCVEDAALPENNEN
jgi:hypothetical protein